MTIEEQNIITQIKSVKIQDSSGEAVLSFDSVSDIVVSKNVDCIEPIQTKVYYPPILIGVTYSLTFDVDAKEICDNEEDYAKLFKFFDEEIDVEHKVTIQITTDKNVGFGNIIQFKHHYDIIQDCFKFSITCDSLGWKELGFDAALTQAMTKSKKSIIEKCNDKDLSTNINSNIVAGTISSDSTAGITSTYPSQTIYSFSEPNQIYIGDVKFDPKKLGKMLKELEKGLEPLKETKKIENKEEKKNMFNSIFNKYKFGKVENDQIAYSMNGLAIKASDDTYVTYKDGTFTNVSNLVMDMPVYIIPVALKDVKVGDIIVHYGMGAGFYVIVEQIKDNAITVVEPFTRERKELVPEKSIFGFNFVAKVITPMTMFQNQANSDNPFGNILPFIMMNKDNEDNSILMAMMMQGSTGPMEQFLPFLLMNDKGSKSDMLEYMMLAQMMKSNSTMLPFTTNNETK